MTLIDAPPYDPRRDNLKRNILIGTGVFIVLAIVLGMGGYILGHGWFFSNLPAEHKVDHFLSALEAKDYSKAYGIYNNDANWQQHPDKYSGYPLPRFTEDWTTDSPVKGPITSHHIDLSKPAALPTDATFIEADIADATVMTRTLSAAKFDGVLHFAALIEAGESMKDPGLYFRSNTVATLSLLEALVASGTQNLVFSSTAAVYGEPESTPILETARLAPTNPYGESKLLVEQMLAWFHRIHGLRYAALRYFNVAGAIAGYGEAHEPESHLIPIILDVALGRRASFSIYGDDYATPDGSCIRDYIHVEDLARAHVLALAALHNSTTPLLYNLGNGRGFSVCEVIEAARRVTGHALSLIHISEPTRQAEIS